MAIDIIARGLASALVGPDGKISSDKMPTVGTVDDTSRFIPIGNLTDPSIIAGKTAEEILLMMLFGVANPTFTNPSLMIELSTSAIAVIGKSNVVSGTLIFDRGSITPPYGTSGYRAGAATGYSVNNMDFENTEFSIDINPVYGENTIACQVHYAAGEQPLNSIGSPYDDPLPAGTITETFIVKGIYELYASDGSILDYTYFEEENSLGYQALLKTESFTEKQAFAISSAITVVGIQQFEPMTQTWMWIGGNPEASLTYFDTTIIEGESLGEKVDYVLYTHKGSLTGEREVRICIE